MRLEDVFPSQPMHDLADGGLCQAELVSDRALHHPTRSKSSDFMHVRLGQFGCGVSTPARLAPLIRHIAHVVALRPEPEVRRADTGRIVAPVEYPELVWDRAVLKFPGETVGVDQRPTPAAKRAIARRRVVAASWPARPDLWHMGRNGAVHFYSRVEAFSKWMRLRKCVTGVGAKSPQSDLDDTRYSKKLGATSLTDARNATLTGHEDLPPGVMLPDVSASREHFVCEFYQIRRAL